MSDSSSNSDKCLECGRPVSKEGAPVFCDYHHWKAMKEAKVIVALESQGKTLQVECSNCHGLSDFDACYYIKDMVRLCETCYQNDRTLKK
jgi:hypothetical protein